MTNADKLTKRFFSLNKAYIKLDKTFSNKLTDSETECISDKLEDIQIEMSLVSMELEKIEDLY